MAIVRQQSPRVRASRLRCAALAALSLLAGCRFDSSGIGPFARQDAASEDGALPQDAAGEGDAAPGTDADGASCVEHACVAGELLCVTGSGERQVERACALGCNAAGDDCVRLAPSNFDADVLIHGTGELSIAGAAALDTTRAELRVGGALQQLPAGVELFTNPSLVLVVAQRVHVAPAAELRVTGDRPLIIAAADTIVVEGTLDCAARGPNPGPGGQPGASVEAAGGGCGGGFAGLAPNTPLPPYHGGGGASFGGSGGDGGRGLGAPPPCGAPSLVPLTGGNSGGGGVDTAAYAAGGAGGGAVQLTAQTSVRIGPAGIIDCGGGGGGGANVGSGGGGGSGGAILVEAPRVLIEGTLAANGGGGGGGSGIASPDNGEPGTDGQPSAVPAPGGASGSIPGVGWAGAGGAGSGGDQLTGSPSQDGKDPRGGGGGGAGRIVIRTASGAHEGTGVLSPSRGPALVFDKLKTQ